MCNKDWFELAGYSEGESNKNCFTLIAGNHESYIRVSMDKDKMLEASKNPRIPNGFQHVWGKWNENFTIKEDFTGSQYVWVPAAATKWNGTLDGSRFDFCYGCRANIGALKRRIYIPRYHCALMWRILSVIESGGFYISAFNISEGKVGSYVSVPDAKPITNISYLEAAEIAQKVLWIKYNKDVITTLPTIQDYETILEWTGGKNVRYNGIYDFNEGVREWVCGDQYNSKSSQVIWGGVDEERSAATFWNWEDVTVKHENLGIRAVLIV